MTEMILFLCTPVLPVLFVTYVLLSKSSSISKVISGIGITAYPIVFWICLLNVAENDMHVNDSVWGKMVTIGYFSPLLSTYILVPTVFVTIKLLLLYIKKQSFVMDIVFLIFLFASFVFQFFAIWFSIDTSYHARPLYLATIFPGIPGLLISMTFLIVILSQRKEAILY